MRRIKDNLSPKYMNLNAKILYTAQITVDRETTLKITDISSKIRDGIKKELRNERTTP